MAVVILTYHCTDDRDNTLSEFGLREAIIAIGSENLTYILTSPGAGLTVEDFAGLNKITFTVESSDQQVIENAVGLIHNLLDRTIENFDGYKLLNLIPRDSVTLNYTTGYPGPEDSTESEAGEEETDKEVRMDILLYTIRCRVTISEVLPGHRRDQFRDNYELLTEESANYELSFNDDHF